MKVHDAEGASRLHVGQGEFMISGDPNVVLGTVLGSCVAACIRDPVAQIGGMNHFLLPGDDANSRTLLQESYGVHLMELLLNGLMQRGAVRSRLVAKLFGGARVVAGLSDVGKRNGEFARRFLDNEGIPVVGGDLGGDRGRRLQFWPVSGRARQILLPSGAETAVLARPPKPVQVSFGEVELF